MAPRVHGFEKCDGDALLAATSPCPRRALAASRRGTGRRPVHPEGEPLGAKRSSRLWESVSAVGKSTSRIGCRPRWTSAFVTGGSGFIGGAADRAAARRGHGGARAGALGRRGREVGGLGAEPVRGDLERRRQACARAQRAATCSSTPPRRSRTGATRRSSSASTWTAPGTCSRRPPKPACGASCTWAPRRRCSPASRSCDATRRRRCGPDSPALYSSTKAKAEQAVRDANRDGFETVVVRPRFVWGKGDTSAPPRARRHGEERPLPLDRRRPPPHLHHARGQHRRGPLLGATKGEPGGVYFVTDGEPVVFRDFLTELLATQGVTPPATLPRAVGDGRRHRARLANGRAGRAARHTARGLALRLECTIDISSARGAWLRAGVAPSPTGSPSCARGRAGRPPGIG